MWLRLHPIVDAWEAAHARVKARNKAEAEAVARSGGSSRAGAISWAA